MNQISRLPPSGVCYYFTSRHFDKSFICSRCLVPHKFLGVDPSGLSKTTLDDNKKAVLQKHECTTKSAKYDFSYFAHEPTLLKYQAKNRKNIGPYGKKLKETELLKVTNKEATEKTMTVGKLNASLVTAFAKEPGMILSDTRDTRYKKKTKISGTIHQEQRNSDVRNSKKYSEESRAPKVIYNFATEGNHSPSYGDFSSSAVNRTNNSAAVPKNSSHISQNDLNPTQDILFPTSVKNKEEDLCGDSRFKELQDFSEAVEDISESSSKSDLLAFFKVKDSTFDNFDGSGLLVHSAIDVCVNSGMLDQAYELLRRNKVKNIKKSNIYDLVLQGYADKGEWIEVQNILRLMEDHNVPPSHLTFALALDCLYRVPEDENYKKQKAKTLLQIFQSMGYRIVDLFQNTTVNSYKRENILEVVRWFFPNFVPINPCFSPRDKFRLVADLFDEKYVVKPPITDFTADQMVQAVEEQLTLETQQFCEVEAVVKRGVYCPTHKEDWLKLISHWENNIRFNFRRYLNALRVEVKGKSHIPNIYQYLNCLPEKKFVNLMVHEINYLCLISEGFTMSTNIIYKNIGNKVWHSYCVRKKVNNNELMGKYKDFINTYSSWYLNPTKPVQSTREKWLNMMWNNPDVMCMGEGNIPWPEEVKVKIGKFLFDIILKSTIIPAGFLSAKGETKAIPGFYLVLRCSRGNLSEQVKFHPAVGSLYRRANLNTLFFDVAQLPMTCPPKPWTSIYSGGFYILPTHFLRTTQFNYNMKMLRSMRSRNLSVIFDSLNQLQSTPWRVNESVLDTALKVFREGGSRELNVPVYPDMSPLPEPNEYLDTNEKAAAYRERLKIVNQRQADFGLWCEGLYKLSLANHFRNRIFWLPHNMDFRGRVYPVPPHICHISGDLYRSLFLFAKKEPLGKNGLDWLKIHAINLTGSFSKRPVSERLEYANEVLDDILDSAEKPLDGRRWWAQSEEPWQTLAACFEIRNALKSKTPETYKTGFPIHQDGSCNGLQHYAALGRDSIGAASVNLKPSDSPQDVYTVVANMIEEVRKKDAKEGVEIASILEGFVTRKVVKQTVMTTVYGVTIYGAKLQILNRLEDRCDFPQERVKQAAIYLAAKVFEVLKEMFTSAKEIQDWFLKCADVITGPYQSTVSWVTPLGLPVVQPYFKNLNNSRDLHINLLPDKRKQKNAFPPNFIHSLDSSHMMLTALFCGKAGLNFASVHDCFWTHPSNVEIMNRICREKFISLHSEEILSDLSNHFLETYKKPKLEAPDNIFMEIPKTGDFDLQSVLDSVYFFS